MASLFTTPFRVRIASLEDDLRNAIQNTSCGDLARKGLGQCVQDVLSVIDNSFPSVDDNFSYSDGGTQGPFFVVLATVNYTGSPDFFDIQPANHFMRLPNAQIDKAKRTITFRCAVQEGDSKQAIVQRASEERDFINFYLGNLQGEWNAWYSQVQKEVNKILEEKDATCRARSNFISELNS
jgi:hypothetical protein